MLKEGRSLIVGSIVVQVMLSLTDSTDCPLGGVSERHLTVPSRKALVVELVLGHCSIYSVCHRKRVSEGDKIGGKNAKQVFRGVAGCLCASQ